MYVVAVDHAHNHLDDEKIIQLLKSTPLINKNPGTCKTQFEPVYPTIKRKNCKRFVPEEVIYYEPPKQITMTNENINVNYIYESSRNINQDTNSVDSQINKFKQTFSQNEIKKVDHYRCANNYDATIKGNRLTDNHTSYSNSSYSNTMYFSILRSNLLTAAKNNVRIPNNISTETENGYAEISKKILQKEKNKDLFSKTQIKTNFFENGYKKPSNIKHTTSDMNIIYVEDTDDSIKKNSKIYVDKDEDIYSIVEYPDIYINDGKKMHGGIGKDHNNKADDTDICINGGMKVHVNVDEDNNINVEDNFISFLKNDFNSKKLDNIVISLNNFKIGKKVFNRLVQMQFISYLLFNKLNKINTFRTRELHWKNKYNNLVREMKQVGKRCKRVLKKKNVSNTKKFQTMNFVIQADIEEEMEVQTASQFSNQDNNSKMLSNIIQIDLTQSQNESFTEVPNQGAANFIFL